jgi:hypothetical protein
MATGQPAKLCVFCGADCAGRPRTKDAQGRYYHKECYEKVMKERRAQAAPRGARREGTAGFTARCAAHRAPWRGA